MGRFDTKFGSERSDWETPQALFDLLDREFHFTLDAAADPSNTKCSSFLSRDDNALTCSWSGVCWLNPPYGDGSIGRWVRKAQEEGAKGCKVVMLIPARTNTNWWHEYVMRAAEVRFLRGRPKFGGATHGLPQPLAIVVFRSKQIATEFTSLDVRCV